MRAAVGIIIIGLAIVGIILHTIRPLREVVLAAKAAMPPTPAEGRAEPSAPRQLADISCTYLWG